jgi:hypothetical protein
MRRALSSASFFLLILFSAGSLVSQTPKKDPKDNGKDAKERDAQDKNAQEGAEEGQEPEEKAEKRPTGDTLPYVEFQEKKYISPEKEGASPTISLKFNLVTDVPKGAKIYFELEYNALSLDEVEYTLKDENRRNLTLTWKPKQRLAVGEYFLRTRMPLQAQTPAIQKALKQSDKRFPPKNEPWSCYYADQPLLIGGPAEEAAEQKAICEAYQSFIDKLLGNMDEFKEKIDKVNAGQELVNAGTLDVEKFKAFIIEWRKKQGELQKSIVEFQVKEPALFQKSITAFADLRLLGQMVSKRAYLMQKEVTAKYKVEEINPKETHQYFDRVTKFKADADGLTRKMNDVLRHACPAEVADTDGADAAEGEGDKKAEAGKEGDGNEEKPSGDGKQGKKAPEKGEKTEKTAKKPSGKK